MDTKSKILFGIFGILIVLSVSASYYKFMVLHDYVVQAEVDCDPETESCFVWQCDPEVADECTGNPEEDIWYFKIAHRNAKNIPYCDPNDDSCLAFQCPENGEDECDEVLCSTDTLDEYAIDGICTNPEDFVAFSSDEDVLTDEENATVETLDSASEPE